MRSWQVVQTGEPEGMQLAEIAEPRPDAETCLVRVEAAALNFSDLLMIRGAYQVKPPLPFAPGQEIAGTVISAPAGSGFAAGDRIASKVMWGGFAEHAAVRADMLIRVPDAMSAAEAAALPVVYPTAHIALMCHGGLKSGDTVLVHAAAGGVGLAAVQIAHAKGARVIATAGGEEKLALARDHGADVAIDYRDDRWIDKVRAATGGSGADLIFDPVGGAVTENSLRCIAWGGRLLIVGFASGAIPAINAARLLIKNASAVGVYWSHERDGPLVAETVEDLLAMYETGGIKPLIGARYAFEAAPRALRDLEARKTTGKVVLEVAGP